jgi:hypothetical protein
MQNQKLGNYSTLKLNCRLHSRKLAFFLSLPVTLHYAYQSANKTRKYKNKTTIGKVMTKCPKCDSNSLNDYGV